MTALPEYPFMSVQDYLLLDNASQDVRYEYVDGQLRMLAGGSLHHSRIAFNFAKLLDDRLSDGPCAVYNSDTRVQLAAGRYVYPDLTVTCDEREADDMIRYPRVIVEVLSPSTEAFDRGLKFALYRACLTVEEYVLVDSSRKTVEVYSKEEAGWLYAAYSAGETVVLRNLNMRFAVDVLYNKVHLPE